MSVRHSRQPDRRFISLSTILVSVHAATLCLLLLPTLSADEPTSGSVAGDLFQFAPTTPAELIEAAQITRKLDRTEDARAFLRKVLDLQLSEPELLALRQELGAGPFLQFRADLRLLPESATLLKAVNSAAATFSLNSQELQAAVQDLGKPGVAASKAFSRLVASGDAAVPVLLAADPNTSAGKASREILVAYARQFRGRLLEEMNSSAAEVRVRILNLLAGTADPELALRLLRWEFDSEKDATVSAAARNAVVRLSRGAIDPGSGSEAAEILVGHSEELIREAESRFSRLAPSVAERELNGENSRSVLLASAKTMLQDAFIIGPENPHVATLLFVVDCAGVHQSVLADASVSTGKSADELLSGLATALDLHATTAATEILRGLRATDPGTTDLKSAGEILRKVQLSPDPRVRLLTWDVVQRRWPVELSGSGVSRDVAAANSGSLKPEVVIVSADEDQAQALQQVFEDAGYTAKTAETGPDGVEIAYGQMNCELFILSAEAPVWPMATTLANLRADVRTQNTPMVVVGHGRFADEVLALARVSSGVWFLPEPVGKYTLVNKLRHLTLPPKLLSAEDRADLKTLARP